jgi:hypothetical protein
MDQALAAMSVLLDPNTPDPAMLDPAVAGQLMVGYQLIYVATYERVLLIIAAVCLGGAAVAWFGLWARTKEDEVILTLE